MCALYATLEIACVHLQSWLCCPAFHSTSGVWFCYAGSKAKLAHLTLVEDIVVVIAMSVLKLLVVCVYVLADGLRSAEIKRCAFYFQYLASRNACLVDREIEVCIHLADKVLHGWGRVCYSGEREESVVG